jgi:hypothetical protein
MRQKEDFQAMRDYAPPLSESVVIDISSVVDHVYRTGKIPYAECVAPPFISFFTESKVFDWHGGKPCELGDQCWTDWFERNWAAKGFAVLNFLAPISQYEGYKWFAPFIEDTAWILRQVLFIDTKQFIMPFWEWVHLISDMGKHISGKSFQCVDLPMKNDQTFDIWNGTLAASGIPNMVLFAIGLINTKNVELIDHIPPPKLSKKHEKKYGEPLVTYKTIQVNPMRTVKRMDGDEVPSSERDTTSQGIQPLHIVAGNFADYRDGPGMFGNPKLKGVFWRPQHIRGNADRGVVVKDYEVKAPEDQS